MNNTRSEALKIASLTDSDRSWVRGFTINNWGSPEIVVHGNVYSPQNLQGFIARDEGVKVGLVTWVTNGAACEIFTFNSACPASGIGSALLRAPEDLARNRAAYTAGW